MSLLVQIKFHVVESDIKPLARIELNGKSKVVAAVYRPAGKGRFAFLPEFAPRDLIAPYLLSDKPKFSNPARPQLDRISSTVLSTTGSSQSSTLKTLE